MNSNIFCFSSKPENKISAYNVEERICNEVADYCGETEREDFLRIVESFKDNYYGIFEVSEEGNFFKVKVLDKKRFFSSNCQMFLAYLKYISMTLTEEFETAIEKFSTFDIEGLMYDLNAKYEDKFDDWVYWTPEEGLPNLVTFPEFMRGVNDGDEFYLVSIFDYHA